MAFQSKGSGVEVNRKVMLIACGVLAVILYFFWPFSRRSLIGSPVQQYHNWNTKTFVDIPQEVLDRQKDVKIEERRVAFEFENQQVTVFMLEARPLQPKSDIPLLLLHGAGDSSEIWKFRVKTLQMAAAIGYRVVAIDLPGWGMSDKDKMVKSKGDFLARFMKHRDLHRPIIVAPSMAGSYAIPYLMGSSPATCADRARGFIPIAPVQTDTYSHAEYHRCEAPTMIVYGTEDKGLGLTSVGNLRNMVNSVIQPMQKQGHACYINKPDEWHYLLYNFLLAVEREQD